MNETFRCAVTDLVTTPVLTVNGWWFDGNPAAEIPEEVVICGLQEASVNTLICLLNIITTMRLSLTGWLSGTEYGICTGRCICLCP